MKTPKMKHFIGTHYYRPPNPEPELWEQDFAEIARMGMSVVRCWVYWRTVQPAPDRWDWSSYDRFMDLAAKNGLKALVQLVPESSPQWFINQHPDLRPLGWDGRPMPMDGNGMIAVGGYPGMFFDQPVVAEAIADFFNAAVQRYAAHPALYAWDPWNEIAPHGGIISYDEVTRKAFQRYLQTRFASVENLNAALQQQFQSFDDVPLLPPDPTQAPTMFRVIFEEFRSQRLTQEMARRCQIIRAADPHHRVVGHAARTMFHTGGIQQPTGEARLEGN
jgi:beta-galactosidase